MARDAVIDLDEPEPSVRPSGPRPLVLAAAVLVALAIGVVAVRAHPSGDHRPAPPDPGLRFDRPAAVVDPSVYVAFGFDIGSVSTRGPAASTAGFAWSEVTNIGDRTVRISGVSATTGASGLRITGTGVIAAGARPADRTTVWPASRAVPAGGHARLVFGFVRTCASDTPVVTLVATVSLNGEDGVLTFDFALDRVVGDSGALPACARSTVAPATSPP